MGLLAVETGYAHALEWRLHNRKQLKSRPLAKRCPAGIYPLAILHHNFLEIGVSAFFPLSSLSRFDKRHFLPGGTYNENNSAHTHANQHRFNTTTARTNQRERSETAQRSYGGPTSGGNGFR